MYAFMYACIYVNDTCMCLYMFNEICMHVYMGDFKKNEDFSFSENNLNIKWYERKVNILKQAQW